MTTMFEIDIVDTISMGKTIVLKDKDGEFYAGVPHNDESSLKWFQAACEVAVAAYHSGCDVSNLGQQITYKREGFKYVICDQYNNTFGEVGVGFLFCNSSKVKTLVEIAIKASGRGRKTIRDRLGFN